MDPLNNDSLFNAWADSHGKDFPKKTVMLRLTEVSPLEPREIWADGWGRAFYSWASKRLETRCG